jgi:2-C-methyl-D-erythritol 4-phosphate cytidylyltransferase
MKAGAIIVAAGRSERMGGADKLLRQLDGRPLISYSLTAFATSPAVDSLVVVVSNANRDAISALANELAPSATIVVGGARRQDSVRAGLEAVGDVDYVVVHDGARPLVTPALIASTLQAAVESGAAICALPVSDTIKRAEQGDLIAWTVPRQGLWLAQTPQAFRRDLLLRAHEQSYVEATDDAALVERLHEPVRLVQGSARNIKVTTLEDFELAEALLHTSGVTSR